MTAEHQVIKASAGNVDAEVFLKAWFAYLHLIDDIADADKSPAEITTVARWANDLYSLPFYLSNISTLRPLVQLITCVYEESNTMSESGVKWQEDAADTLRHCGADMIRIVAYLTGGYLLMKEISMELREACYNDHHTKEGVRI